MKFSQFLVVKCENPVENLPFIYHYATKKNQRMVRTYVQAFYHLILLHGMCSWYSMTSRQMTIIRNACKLHAYRDVTKSHSDKGKAHLSRTESRIKDEGDAKRDVKRIIVSTKSDKCRSLLLSLPLFLSTIHRMITEKMRRWLDMKQSRIKQK